MSTSDWIARIKAEDESAKAASEAKSQEQVREAFTLSAKAPAFWRELLDSLSVDAKDLSEIGLYGAVSRFGKPGEETSCRVSVEYRGLSPNLTYTDLHYGPGGVIRGNVPGDTIDGQEFSLPIATDERGKVGARYRGQVLTPQETAKVILERMVKMVRPRRAS